MANQTDGRDIFGWQTGAERDLAQQLYDNKEMPHIGLVNRGLGVNEDDIRHRADQLQQRDLGGKYDGQLAAVGQSPVALGENSATVLQRLETGRKQTKKDNNAEAVTLQHELTRPDREAAAKVQQESVDARREGNQLTRENNNNTMKLAVMNMQEQAATRRDDLVFRKEEARREDMRYNERMDQLDRKDRKALMQNMAMGIASLGAAFAI